MPGLQEVEEEGAGARESPAGAKGTGPGLEGVCSRVETVGRGKEEIGGRSTEGRSQSHRTRQPTEGWQWGRKEGLEEGLHLYVRWTRQ